MLRSNRAKPTAATTAIVAIIINSIEAVITGFAPTE